MNDLIFGEHVRIRVFRRENQELINEMNFVTMQKPGGPDSDLTFLNHMTLSRHRFMHILSIFP